MARRRLAAAAAGMQNMADIYFRHILQQQAADAAQTRQDEQAKTQAALGMVPDIRAGKVQRGMIPPDQLARLEEFVDIDAIFPSNQEISSRIGAGIEGAKNPTELPSGIQGITDMLRASGGDVSPTLRQTPMEGGPNTLPSTQFAPGQRPEIEQLDKLRQTREDQLVKHGPVTQMPFYSEKDNRMHNQFVPQSQAPAYGALPQGPTPEQAGANTLAEKQAGELSPAMTQAQADAKNMLSRLTRPSLQADAQAQSFGSTFGQQSAWHQDPFTEQRIEEARRIAEAQNRANPMGTEGERNAAAAVLPLITADAKMREFEQAGTYIRPGAMTSITSPIIGAVAGAMNYFSPEDQQYATAALDYVNNIGKIMSGVQVRPDERDSFLAVMAVGPQDKTYEQKEQKRQARAAFNASAQSKLGRSADEAGRALGMAIAGGIIPQAILPTLEFTDDVFRTSMEAVLRERGVIQ